MYKCMFIIFPYIFNPFIYEEALRKEAFPMLNPFMGKS